MSEEFDVAAFCREMRAYTLLKRQLNLTGELAEALAEAGFTSIEDVANAPASTLQELLGGEDVDALQARARRSAAPSPVEEVPP